MCTYMRIYVMKIVSVLLQVGGRGRRSTRNSNSTASLPQDFNFRSRKNFEDQFILVVPLERSRARNRILQLQPSLKQMVCNYIGISINISLVLAYIRNNGCSVLYEDPGT